MVIMDTLTAMATFITIMILPVDITPIIGDDPFFRFTGYIFIG
jgi:hypothetical protein